MVIRRLNAILLAAGVVGSIHAAADADVNADFVKQVKLAPFELVAVQNEGQFKTFDTLAKSIIRALSHDDVYIRTDLTTKVRIRQSAAFTFLDMMFRPGEYRSDRIVYVKETEIRKTLLRAAKDRIDKRTLDEMLEDGRVSLSFLAMPEVRAALQVMNADVMRTARKVNTLEGTAQLTDARVLESLTRIIPPPAAETEKTRWFSIDALRSPAPADAAHAGVAQQRKLLAGFTQERQDQLAAQWEGLRKAWLSQDSAAVNAALERLSGELRQINPRVYPGKFKLSLEHLYYRLNKLMWSWVFYLIALALLLMGAVYRWRGATVVGTCVFGLAFFLHTVACGVRWYLAGRIPNSNMFEAVTAAAWLGAAIAIFIELGPWFYSQRSVWRIATIGTPIAFCVWLGTILIQGIPINAWQQWHEIAITALLQFSIGCMTLISLAVSQRMLAARGLPLLTGAFIGMVALMCGAFMKNSLDSDIGRTMPVLSDLWLYIHTNMVIASYALIAMAFLMAALYLVGRLLTSPLQQTLYAWVLLVVFAVAIPLCAVGDIMDTIVGWVAPATAGLATRNSEITIMTVMPAWIPFLTVFGMLAAAALVRLLWQGAAERARLAWDGVGVPEMGERAVGMPGLAMAGAGHFAGSAYLAAKPGGATGSDAGRRKPAARDAATPLAKVFDGSTMLLLELSFITLWTGIIMGAIWADHSWGRPWGWDPKEVFALNTWIIFLILVHVRLKVVDKELWTAVLAVIGTAVMMFNWVVVNFFIVGLHSYA